jgi:hypothetical protein
MLCLQRVKFQDIILAQLVDKCEDAYAHFKYKKCGEISIFRRRKDINCRDLQRNERTYITLAKENAVKYKDINYAL